MNKAALGIVAVVVAAVAAGAGYWLGQRPSAPVAGASGQTAPGAGAAKAPGAAGGGAGGPAAGVPVEVVKVATASLPQSITTVGSLRSDESVTIRPEVAGRIAEIDFQEGQRVTKGAVLLRLDPSINEAEVLQARANLTLARSKYERAVDLSKSNFISGQAQRRGREQPARRRGRGRARRGAAREDRDPGAVHRRDRAALGVVGDYVKEGADIVNLESIDLLKVDFRVPEVYLRQVKAGQPLQVALDAYPGKTFEGRVFAVNPLLDAAGRAVVIRAQVKNADASLRPGMFARVRLITSESTDSLVVPEQALVPQGSEQFVFKVVDGHGRARQGRGRAAPRRQGRDGERRDGGTKSSSSRAASTCATACRSRSRAPARRRRRPRPGRGEGRGSRAAGGRRREVGPTAGRRYAGPADAFLTGAPRCNCPRSASSAPSSRRCCRWSSCWSGSSRTRGCRCASTRASTSRWSSVDTTYRGASAEVVESQVTKALEDSLAGIEGVELMTSQSRSERSQINVRFRLTRDPDSAAADVRDKVSRVRGRLPDTVDEPVIAKVEADSQPIIYMAVQAGSQTPLEASDYVARYIKPRLSVLPGAADVRIFGERQVSMRIKLDRTRLAGYRLTVQDVEDAIRRQNVEIPAGRIESTAASSPSSPRPTCRRPSSSTRSSSPTSAATRCACATSAPSRSARSTSG